MSGTKGLVMVFTGDGKGKTTAALGMGMRAWGQGKKVLVLQFIKGSRPSGELEAAARLGENFVIRQFGKGFTFSGGGRPGPNTRRPPAPLWKRLLRSSTGVGRTCSSWTRFSTP